jgi:hypothetical protein
MNWMKRALAGNGYRLTVSGGNGKNGLLGVVECIDLSQ